MKVIDEYIKTIEKELTRSQTKIKTEEQGVVSEVKDGVVILQGLDNVSYGELIEFKNGVVGYVVDLTEDEVGAIVLGDYLGIKAGDQARALSITLSVPVSESILGRVVDSLGNPIDGGGKIKSDKRYPIEKIAPGVVKRQPVNQPVQTGIKSIDALIPIGRGQRELIIGDRGTGKTTLAVDTILNQKNENMICIYCAIGQKTSKIASLVHLLKTRGAMDYTVVVAAFASDPASMQYLAPYSATAIAEYFMDRGRDVLVIYDDLTKHAWAYRQISLILRRPAGREAYPGDVFYLHSRLLERACRLNEKNGGGSITALPIIETLEGDLSTYIPTNVISITDGQIFLETDLFNAGIRPAINVGLSVSRVGGHAQTKAMKKIAGRLKLDLAQYNALAAFSQFEGELDEETKKLLNRGAKVTQVLKQKKGQPLSLSQQIAIIWTATNGYLDLIDNEKISEFEEKLLEIIKIKGKKWSTRIEKTKLLEQEDEKELKKFIESVNL
ncbi:MAG: ATP synthase subunit alpha [Candidatus Roizmanbacteria bacterium GW2011_GWC2_37_13]|uniref:ATP synthase subunit alpha n=1 Tax=Candidatus Roizmanbacteria bacterium GW2011_GWC2_37_13 TaxID=1618486 RepID=A0A0G0G4V0_9BACT|nr:MAG: ATP synthase subunit alpha [Candidatus Roizmanbacteria bacterium GW2011_GWC1_37_12]KKQ25072.1 MAG: ATP synthase subunit alpha [Candidatus Roizmanbacteria bacterium GW2011_GWC2_37_13]